MLEVSSALRANDDVVMSACGARRPLAGAKKLLSPARLPTRLRLPQTDRYMARRSEGYKRDKPSGVNELAVAWRGVAKSKNEARCASNRCRRTGATDASIDASASHGRCSEPALSLALPKLRTNTCKAASQMSHRAPANHARPQSRQYQTSNRSGGPEQPSNSSKP
jgi:hypothetical protein